MKKILLSEEDIIEIQRLYSMGEMTKVDIANKYKVAPKRIKTILSQHRIQKPTLKNSISYEDVIALYEERLLDGMMYVAKCKQTGKTFNDYSNASGCLSQHLIKIIKDIQIPTSFLRRSYAIKNKVFWHEKYFEILQVEKPKPKEEIENEIVRLYMSKELSSTHKIAEKFKIGHKKVSEILKLNGVDLNSKGNQSKGDITKIIEGNKTIVYESLNTDTKFVAVCKKTGVIINDPNNYSGFLTNHIKKEYGEVSIPANTYQRKKYELVTGHKWYEEYFDIIEVTSAETIKCRYCDWTTEDLTNKSGSITKHLTEHNITVSEHLENFPQDAILWDRQVIMKNKIETEESSVLCLECENRFMGLTETHMKSIHNISIDDYKKKWGEDVRIFSNNTKILLSEKAIETNLNMEYTFISKPQLEIGDYISNELLKEVKLSDKKELDGKEIDLFISEKKIAFEFNGLYWHSENHGKHSRYHADKTDIALNKGIYLYHIFEDEWRDKKDIVKSRIANILGCNKNKIFARKCIIKEITSKLKNEYLIRTHIQGVDKASISYGAFYNDTLVGVMTFSCLRRSLGYNNEKNTYEMTRFSNDGVIGLASKFISRFIKDYEPTKIITYADKRWTPNHVSCLYTKIGFTYVKTSKPNYWYTKDYKNRLHRFNYRKDILVNAGYDKNKTETVIMNELGYDKIWDCGSHKFIMVIK